MLAFMSTVLVIEDDETIGAALVVALVANGYGVARASTGRDALERAARLRPDLVLLDLGLPDVDGLIVCRELRAALPTTIIVVLTARRQQLDIVSGLESGADDYLTKPFSTVEILARVRAHLRRAAIREPGHEGDPVEVVTVGCVRVDHGARRVSVSGREVPVRAREFDLLARFVASPGVALRRETLMEEVWDENWFGSTKTLDVHVASLRRRLAETAATVGPEAVASLPVITTLRGHGYRLELAAGMNPRAS